ncbi:MAG: enoyl-CoA hydratase/isomerase family protein [Caulobacteraceae bacterium]|nr:enoyl-CoA hydratase/isomerase family protein [Caulobacteraceae bacterium]
MIRYERVGRVAVVSYDHQARRNAWGLALYREAVAAIEKANADEEVGAIVITHEGPVYCSGADFKDAPETDPETGRRVTVAMLAMAQDKSWLHLLARSKPSIGAIRGAAMGLGITQILPFDIRLGGEGSTYAFPFLKLQVMPELGCTALLPRLVGYGRAVHICLSAATLDAREAERIGLITGVYPDNALREQAIALAEQIAGYPALQTRLTRELLKENAGEHDLNVLLQRETDAFITMFKERRRQTAGA